MLIFKRQNNYHKTLIVPQVQFLFGMMYVEDKVIKRIEKMLYSFIWSKNVHKIKKNTLIAPIEAGGLGMIDMKSCNLAAKGTWVCRLLSVEKAKWKELTWFMLNIKKRNLVNSNCLLQVTAKSEFHKQIINAWSDINSFIPITIKEIINQSISENKYVKI